ncbi:hypothetical protein niasHS_018129 [Heterodera schachtii]|uniref:BTB domain-containing protein n=1 Tax=Heterodera schachtii TaxID=97005 RepID=A0ABD2HPC1_HETSC
MIEFAALEFQICNRSSTLQIKDIGNVSNKDSKMPLAQIVRWGWNNSGAQVIRETKILDFGGSIEFYNITVSNSIVIRILRKRETTVVDGQNPCPSLMPIDDDLTVKIGDKKVILSAHWLMSVSPVIRRMLSTEMREKQQRSLTFDEFGVDMEQFMEFVEAISPVALQKQILPNPENVLMLLRLADFFQVNWLKRRCETHLANCVEIPLIDRFHLIKQFGLDNFKNYFLHLNADNLHAFYKANRAQLLPSLSKEFMDELISRLFE